MSNNDTGNQQSGRKGLPTVAVLGIGQMGRPMATRLVSAGFAVRVWDRSPTKIVPLVDAGATAAVSPAQAAAQPKPLPAPTPFSRCCPTARQFKP